MYYYFEVSSKQDYSVFVEADLVQRFLESLPGVRRSTAGGYSRTGPQLWAEIVLAAADARGNYSVGESDRFDTINLIEVICSTHSREAGRRLAEAIARQIGWDVYEADH